MKKIVSRGACLLLASCLAPGEVITSIYLIVFAGILTQKEKTTDHQYMAWRRTIQKNQYRCL